MDMHALRQHFQTALMATPDGPAFAQLRLAMAHWAWALIVAAVALEIGCYLLIQRRVYPWGEMFSSVAVHIMRLPMQRLQSVIAIPVVYVLWSHRLFTIPLNTAWGLLLLFLGEEIAYYWMHRLSHEVRWLWASHVVHHTPEHLHLASAVRDSVTGPLSGTWLFYLPLYFLGFNPIAVSAILGINGLYQFWLHTDLVGRLGPLEWIFNTPSNHRVHHASNSQYLDRNYGGMLIIFDRLFGTFAQEKPGTVIKYGLTRPLGSLNPVKIVLQEWAVMVHDFAQAQTWREKLAQLFGRPAI
jgi:sterol desaturase/sphingolipid hydroxylase (fatty acid hydroxylase superfamily)